MPNLLANLLKKLRPKKSNAKAPDNDRLQRKIEPSLANAEELHVPELVKNVEGIHLESPKSYDEETLEAYQPNALISLTASLFEESAQFNIDPKTSNLNIANQLRPQLCSENVSKIEIANDAYLDEMDNEPTNHCTKLTLVNDNFVGDDFHASTSRSTTVSSFEEFNRPNAADVLNTNEFNFGSGLVTPDEGYATEMIGENGSATTLVESKINDEALTFEELFGLPSENPFQSTGDDSYALLNDSDSDPEDRFEFVTFHVVNESLVAEYKCQRRHIHYLDLTEDELSILSAVNETSVSIDVNPNYIVLNDNVLSINRIEERSAVPDPNFPIDILSAESNTERIQFSVCEPLMAKYKGFVYLVGKNLQTEYMALLRVSGYVMGTAIRINTNRIVINSTKQILNVVTSIPFKTNQKVFVIAAASVQKDIIPKEYAKHELNSAIRRYVIGLDSSVSLLEVEPQLLYSSANDDCDEIYAETDFVLPFSEANDNRQENVPELSDSDLDYLTESDDDEDSNFLKMQSLPGYTVSKNIREIVRNKAENETSENISMWIKQKSLMRSDSDNYCKSFKTAVSLEEEAQTLHIETFDVTDIKLTYHMDRIFYFPIEDRLSKISAAIDENILDWFYLVEKKKKKEKKNKKGQINGHIHKKYEGKIYIEIFAESFKTFKRTYTDGAYNMYFTLNRVTYQLQQHALQFMAKHELFELLIQNPMYQIQPKNVKKTCEQRKIELKGKSMENLNSEQVAAVINIVDGQNYPLPYVLFGPPGTGKTKTLVAAIEQIVRTTTKHVLVCTMSNAACDEITDRLVDLLDQDQIFRMYAKTQYSDKIPARIKPISNWSSAEGKFYFPSLKMLYEFRVLLCTLATSGCLTRARIDKAFKANHFSYVFIDEGASAHETMTLIPIAGLCTSKNKVEANIVLAGDPKQLGALTRFEKATKMGYNVSWLERLCACNLYKRDSTTGKLNETYITQLVKNYRSHPAILKIPNELFYENKLVAKAPTGITNWYINSKFLPSKHFPIIFQSVQGKCEQSDIDFSLYNTLEVDTVFKYIKKLLPLYGDYRPWKKITQSDIGVVTPYKKQCQKIAQKCRHYSLDEITVGTAEVFQGKEKPVMIVSTVRSDGKYLGFVNDPRRFNVVLTRAKCLLIIVGDPFTLRLDNNWKRLIKHCLNNKAFIQSDKIFTA